MRLLLILFIASSLVGCTDAIVGNGNIVQVGREVPNFQDLSTKGSIDVEIQPGENYTVKIVGDENIIPYVMTEVRNGELQVYYQDKISIRNGNIKVMVSAPFLNNISTSGSGNITSTGIISNNQMITITSAGSGNVDLQVYGPAVKLRGSGSGDFTLSGQTKDMECTLSGSGDLDSKDLKAENVKVKISGSSNARLFAAADLSATISGSGNILYWGNPALSEVKISGSGKVKAGE